MKSSFWVLCGVAAFCLGSVRCGRNFADDDENFLDNTKSGDAGGTGKEADIEKSLYKARILWNELTNEISQLSRMHNSDAGETEGGEGAAEEDEDKCTEDNDCKNEGQCKEKEGGSKECVCKEGTSGDKCEDIKDCQDKFKECSGGDKGDCIFKDGKADCKCPAGRELYETKGYCEVDYCVEKCGKVPCKGNKFVKEEVRCVCTDPNQDFDAGKKGCKTNYCRKICGNDTLLKCNENPYQEEEAKDCTCEGGEHVYINKRCQKTCSEDEDCQNEGTCKEEAGRDFKLCDCKKGTSGDTCEIIEECNTKYKECKGDKGDCIFKDGKADCKCSKKKSLNEAKGYCETDWCKVICREVPCEGNKFVQLEMECVCADPNQDFDIEKLECKTDYCRKVCGEDARVRCNGDPYQEKEAKDCSCYGGEHDFINKKCQMNYCRKVCGNATLVKCIGDPYQVKEAKDCTCEGGDHVFINNRCQKTCSEDKDCQNEGTCKEKGGSNLCECKEGTSGDTCEIIEECNTEYRDCKGDKGTCIFKDGKVGCECPEGKALNEAKGYCEVDYCKKKCGAFTCEGNKFVEEEVKCVCPDPNQDFDGVKGECKMNYCRKVCGNAARVKCNGNPYEEKEEKDCTCDGDKYVFNNKKCQIDYCKEKCGDVGCEGDRFVKNDVSCTCPNEDQAFDKDQKKCKKTCSNDDDCKNEGKCKPKGPINQFCECVKGTSGETCEDIADCKGKYKACTGGDKGECVFENGKADCKCPEKKVLNKIKGYCEDDKCEIVCGIGYNVKDDEVKCVGGPFGNVQCQCTDKEKIFDPKEKECKTDYCKEKCGDIKCEGNPLVEEEVKCVCPADQDFIEDEKKCKTNFCRKVCGNDPRVECEGDNYEPKKKADCNCNDGEYVYNNNRCQKTCSNDDDCKNEGKCKPKGENHFCECVRGTTGDTCEDITDCKGKYRECTGGDKGECLFEKGKANCKCPEGRTLYTAKGYCEAKCKKDADCEGSNRKCNNDEFCVCKDGYEGDDCNVITGCEQLKEKCEEIKTECVFGEPGRPICKCEEGYTYDRIENKCKHPYCHPVNPCQEGECTEEAGTGYCKCPENKYYNYKKNKCEDISDLCFLRKTPCGENEKCVNGNCVCKYTVKEGEECKPKLCNPNPCFDKAKCSEEDGYCSCEAGKYNNGKRCEDGKCRFDEFKTNCTCPTGMERKDNNKECQPKDGEACSKDCGYGLCVKKDNKESCKCFNFALPRSGKCILKTNFCPQGLDTDFMKCKCTGKYTQASDGISCRLKTCKDDDVQEECALRGGQCKMHWKGVGYDCDCPDGYDKDENQKCRDPCSIEKNIKFCATEKKQFCYNSFSPGNSKTFDCRCPPTIQDVNGECSRIAKNVYLIKNIPVLKKKYEIKSGINKVLLNAELIQSMEQTFGASLFDYGYLYDYKVLDDVLNCSVWINFKAEPEKEELDKIKLLPKTISKACDDCIENAVVWPPKVLLSEKGLQEAEPNKLNFCSSEVTYLFCGKGTSCNENKCTCQEGFKIIEYSITKIAGYEIQRCEDIDECALGIHSCPQNTTCRNTVGSYGCQCNEGFKKQEVPKDPETDKSNCYDMCTPTPCKDGKCILKDKTFDCECYPGFGGSFCNRKDDNYTSAKKGTVVVGAVLGTILALGAIALLYYIIKVRKNSGSEDFMPAPRMDHAEMTERRPMRGVVNKGYE